MSRTLTENIEEGSSIWGLLVLGGGCSRFRLSGAQEKVGMLTAEEMEAVLAYWCM